MSNAYTDFARDPQGQACDVENLDLDLAVSPLHEVFAFQSRYPNNPDMVEVKWNVITAYESGAIGAVEALRYLELAGAFSDADELMRMICAGARECLLLTPPDGPQPPLAPSIAAPAKEVLDVLAQVRRVG